MVATSAAAMYVLAYLQLIFRGLHHHVPTSPGPWHETDGLIALAKQLQAQPDADISAPSPRPAVVTCSSKPAVY